MWMRRGGSEGGNFLRQINILLCNAAVCAAYSLIAL